MSLWDLIDKHPGGSVAVLVIICCTLILCCAQKPQAK